MVCQSCGVEAPTKQVQFHQNIGALVMRFHKSVNGQLCKNCINRYFWRYTGTSAVLGWWGLISFFSTLVFIPMNIVNYVGALKLEPPAPGAGPPTVTQEVIQKLAAYHNEIFTRMYAHEPMEQVAADISARAGVTPGQLREYVRASVQSAQTQGQPGA